MHASPKHESIPCFALRSPTLLRRYGAATILVLAALDLALLLRHYGLPHPFTSFSFAAIAITFWYAGTCPGFLAVVISYSALTYFFSSVKIGGLSWDSYLIIYGVFGLFVSWFSSSRLRADPEVTGVCCLVTGDAHRMARYGALQNWFSLQEFAINIAGLRVKAYEEHSLNVSAMLKYFVHRDSSRTLFWKTVNACADCRKGNASDLESVRHFERLAIARSQ